MDGNICSVAQKSAIIWPDEGLTGSNHECVKRIRKMFVLFLHILFQSVQLSSCIAVYNVSVRRTMKIPANLPLVGLPFGFSAVARISQISLFLFFSWILTDVELRKRYQN